jgi:hypothetical protein
VSSRYPEACLSKTDVLMIGIQPRICSAIIVVLIHCISRQTTNIKPRSFAVVHFRVYLSLLYIGFLAADVSVDAPAPDEAVDIESSMKTSLMKLLMILGDTELYVFDQSTTPEVVRTSKESSILLCKGWMVVRCCLSTKNDAVVHEGCGVMKPLLNSETRLRKHV